MEDISDGEDDLSDFEFDLDDYSPQSFFNQVEVSQFFSVFAARRRGGLLVCALNSVSSGPGRGYCVVFLGNTFYSHTASFHPCV